MELRSSNELSAVRGFAIGGGDGHAATYDSGRVCAHPGCATKLSVYNASTTCWIHEEAKEFVLRVRNGVANGTAA
jgi:hypothetical protein